MQLAHTLHMETTAEGVKHIEQREVLATLECTHIQGCLFLPAMTGAQTHEYLERDGGRAGSSHSIPVVANRPG
jgi:EAL domain-containing protein (putative c-di-GMP-specific phosphodiesterase class I)